MNNRLHRFPHPHLKPGTLTRPFLAAFLAFPFLTSSFRRLMFSVLLCCAAAFRLSTDSSRAAHFFFVDFFRCSNRFIDFLSNPASSFTLTPSVFSRADFQAVFSSSFLTPPLLLRRLL